MENDPLRTLDRLPAWIRGPWFFVLLAISLYANTIGNEFALDDGLVLSANSHVLKGIPGIPDILGHDSFHGSIGNSAYLSGGRYRPLSLVTYAIEVSIFGPDPAVHHAVNVLLFALNCFLLWRFLRRFIFPTTMWAAWCATLLFTIHPVHTEVVANIKGRDELLSLIFLLLTLHHALAHVQWTAANAGSNAESRSRRKARERSGKTRMPGAWSGALSAVCFALALLSKENGLVFVVVLPLTLYFFTGSTLAEAVKRSLPVIGLVVLYIGLRVLLLEARNNTVQEIMDNPYLLATTPERIGTILYVLLRYIRLMFWPDPLTYDYSFQEIPYRSFTDPFVLLSLLVHGALLAHAIIASRRKDLIAWCILVYFGSLFLVSGLVFNIGAPMAERFLYQASVPFLVGVVEVVRRLVVRSGSFRQVAWAGTALLVLLTTLSSYAVVNRNKVWRTGDDLFLHDVEVSDKSARAQTFAGIAWIHRSDSSAVPAEKRTYALAAVRHFLIADSIHRDYMPTLLNMGLALFRLDSIEAAEQWWDRARAKDARDPKLLQLDAFLLDRYLKGGITAGMKGDYMEGVRQLEKAVKYGPTNADAWYNLGGLCFTVKDYERARTAWERTLTLVPDHKEARQGMAALGALPNDGPITAP